MTLSAEELLAGAGTSFDLIGDYAVPLTVRVICDILGVPDREWRQFRTWGDDVTRRMGVNVSRAQRRRFTAPPWVSETPLGMPVEPEV